MSSPYFQPLSYSSFPYYPIDMGGAPSLRKGDWICTHCSNFNYSFRNSCNRCKFQQNTDNNDHTRKHSHMPLQNITNRAHLMTGNSLQQKQSNTQAREKMQGVRGGQLQNSSPLFSSAVFVFMDEMSEMDLDSESCDSDRELVEQQPTGFYLQESGECCDKFLIGILSE